MEEQSGERARDRAGESDGLISPAPKYDERGLLPAVVQDARTREVLTLAYVNEESLGRSVESGETWFWSRSRRSLWHKGETSGHTQRIVSLRLDCDSDALLILVEPNGPACHTGQTSCFHLPLPAAPAPVRKVQEEEKGAGAASFGRVVEQLYSVVEARRSQLPAGSYTTYLFEQGLNKILKKVGEEAAETIIAAKDEDPSALTAEISDLIYHLLVLMVERGQSLDAVASELLRRAGGKGAQ
jgi:phosphoribosyl-AMP cyclohydrolase / phosphoribosyl-ATP pyrophosphohydrolase